MIQISINDQEFLIKSDISILDALKHIGINVPRFCYHEMLSIAGNCRMCLVEVDNTEKPVASCVTLVKKGMIIHTDTPFVKKARENVVESLLINHPLDCPICDQAGECDLQDQTFSFGSDYSRFFHNKRGVEDKICGPLIKTIMTRCIHCTRCIRFSTEVAGESFLGTFNRGASTEIGNYISGFFKSEISGNVIDLCPVGALTSGPYASKARPWEIRVDESIDLTDSLGAHIYIHFKESEVVRITPKKHWELNNGIISDKARFSYDFLKGNRIKRLYRKEKTDFLKIAWFDFLSTWNSLTKDSQVKINFFFDGELNFIIQDMLTRLSNLLPKKVKLFLIDSSNKPKNYYDTSTLGSVLNAGSTPDCIFTFSSNTKIESPVLNSRLLEKVKNSFTTSTCFGFFGSTNLSSIFVNLYLKKTLRFLEGVSKKNSESLFNSIAPLFLLGESLDQRLNSGSLVSLIKRLHLSTNCLHVVTKSNSCGSNFLKFENFRKEDGVNVFINVNDSLFSRKLINNSRSNFFLGSHGSNLAKLCNYIVPIYSKFECSEVHINLEGRAQQVSKVFENRSDARELGTIFNSTFLVSKKTSTHFDFIYEMLNSPNVFNGSIKDLMSHAKKPLIGESKSYPSKPVFNDFYTYSHMGKNSSTMSLCSLENKKTFNNFSK